MSLHKLVTSDLPKLVDEASELPGRASDVQNSAQSEIDSLSMMDKAKCVAAVASNTKELAKFPGFVKNHLESMKKEMEDMMTTVNKLNSELPKIQEAAEVCAKEGVKFAPQCYKKAYGAI